MTSVWCTWRPSGEEGDIASQLQAGTILQWEAHRDGPNNGLVGQWLETTAAAAAMTAMAQRIDESERYGEVFELTAEQMEIAQAFDEGGMEGLMTYVAENYDFAEGDYLRRINERTGEYGVRPANRLESILPGLFGGPETSDGEGLDSANLDAFLGGVQAIGDVAGYLNQVGVPHTAPFALAGDLATLADQGLALKEGFGLEASSGLIRIDGEVNLNASISLMQYTALEADSLNDFEWFGSGLGEYNEASVDAEVFRFAEEHGIQLSGDISDLANPADAEAASNQMMRNAFFIAHAKLGLGLSDEQTLFLLDGGPGTLIQMDDIRYTTVFPGFDDLNTGPVPNDEYNFDLVDDINTVLLGDAYYNSPLWDKPVSNFIDSPTDQRYWELLDDGYASSLRHQQDNSAFLWGILDAAY